MEKARQQTAEVEARLQEERKEHARQLENTRTQAVLNVCRTISERQIRALILQIHAAHNSAVKVRQASQRRMEPPLSPQANRIASQTPFRGSPTKRESFGDITPFVKSLKGKGQLQQDCPVKATDSKAKWHLLHRLALIISTTLLLLSRQALGE